MPDESQDALGELCRRCHVARLDLFGSATDGRFDPSRSDLDFLVEFEDLSPPLYARNYFALLDGLGELFHRQIDLMTDRSLVNPFLRRPIEEQRRRVYPPA